MNKTEFYEFLEELKGSPGLTKQCCKTLSSLARMIKKMNDLSFDQFIDVIMVYLGSIDDFYNCQENDNVKQLSEEYDNPYEFINAIKDIAEKSGGKIDVIELDPRLNDYQFNTQKKYNDINKTDDIKFIERRSLLANITSTNFTLNDSFMNYLEEILEANTVNTIKYLAYDNDDNSENDSVGLTIGIKNNKDTDNEDLVITIFGGVNRYETFNFVRSGNIGIMDSYDFKYFNSITHGKYIGKYLFKLDDSRRSFIGKKIG